MPDVIRVFQDEGGEWRWHKVADNGEIVATSGEDFVSKDNALRAAEREADSKIPVEVDEAPR